MAKGWQAFPRMSWTSYSVGLALCWWRMHWCVHCWLLRQWSGRSLAELTTGYTSGRSHKFGFYMCKTIFEDFALYLISWYQQQSHICSSYWHTEHRLCYFLWSLLSPWHWRWGWWRASVSIMQWNKCNSINQPSV